VDPHGFLIAATNHHLNCPHYNDSLMDVWKVTDGTSTYYSENEADVREEAAEYEGLEISKTKIHREIYENLPEFDGF